MSEKNPRLLMDPRCAQGKSESNSVKDGSVLLTLASLKTHRRDQLIEWIKGLLAVPFVLSSQPGAVYDGGHDKNLAKMARSAHDRYADIFQDIEALIDDHINHQDSPNPHSKLSMLVPTITRFFTRLSLVEAFKHQDSTRHISARRFVPPSFNDIRQILNSSQLLTLTTPTPTLQLLTFDGDVTLYEDGGSLNGPNPDDPNIPPNPVINRLLHFLTLNIRIGIVTAAGYTDASKYYSRLSGLIDAVHSSLKLTSTQKSNLIIMGGESNFLFVFDDSIDPEHSTPHSSHFLRYIHRRSWILNSMLTWSEPAIQALLSTAESAFQSCITTLSLPAQILRKERAVGIFPLPGRKLTREQLEETVLVVQQVVESSPAAVSSGIPFTTFNGGADVFLDIGDKSLGVQACQKWFGGIRPEHTLHVGDQFLSGGGNDFKARNACCTAWIASPEETVNLLDEIIGRMEGKGV